VTAGRRIRRYRRRLGMSQEVLARRAGVSLGWLAQVERGEISPGSLRRVILVAAAIGVEPMDLVEVARLRRGAADGTPDGLHTLAIAMRRDPDRLPAAGTADLAGIRGRLDQADALVRQCRYDEVGPQLAGLIADAATAAVELQSTEHERSAFTELSHVYRVVAEALLRGGEHHGVAWVAADRCSAAARRTGDPIVEAFAARCRAHVFTHAGWVDAAMETLMPAIDMLAPAAAATAPRPTADPWWTPDPASMRGALLLAGAFAAARSNDPAASERLLRQAEVTAARVPRDDGLFGPTTIAIDTVSCAIELGDVTRALRLGTELDPVALPPEELDRRAQVHLDVALAYDQRRWHESALHRLLEAERIAPELTRTQSFVREMVGAMLHREGGPWIPGLPDLADRVGVFPAE
jgi:transcriptional regulator with XRE-family HTH domain